MVLFFSQNEIKTINPLQNSRGSALKGLSKILNVVSYPRFRYRSLMNMNKKKAITLDVIVIYDNSLCSIIQAMTAKQYFETRGQLFRDNQQSMTICTWDVIPGKASERYKLKIGPRATAIIIFASYDGEDQPHRLSIPPDTKNIMILMNERTLILADNGIDYMDIGEQKKFTVMKKINENNQKDIDNNIPSGYGNFYFLDRDQHPPSIIKDPQLHYKKIKIGATRNIPVRIEEGEKNNMEDRDYHQPDNYIFSKFSNFFELMQPQLEKNLFSEEGIANNNILRQHGVAFLYSSDMTKKRCYLTIEMFLRNKYKNFIIMSQLNRALLAGRKSPLESDEYYEKFGNGSGSKNASGNGTNGSHNSGNNFSNDREGSQGNDKDKDRKNGEEKDNANENTKGATDKNGEKDNETNKNGNNKDGNDKDGNGKGEDKNSKDKDKDKDKDGKGGSGDVALSSGDKSKANSENPNGEQKNNNPDNEKEDNNPEEKTEDPDKENSHGSNDSPEDKKTNSPYGTDGMDKPGTMEKNSKGTPKIPFGQLSKMGSLAMGASKKASFWKKISTVVKKGVTAVSNSSKSTKKVAY